MASELRLRLLVVDNDKPVCEVTALLLKSLGYRVNAVTDSPAALKVFSANPDKFDLAIIEPVLPELTGLDLAIRFRNIRPDFPIMFYAGYVEEFLSCKIDINDLGPIVFKPCTTPELAAAIMDRLSAHAGGGSFGGSPVGRPFSQPSLSFSRN